MDNRANTKVASEINKLNEKETSAVLDYISALITKRISKSKENNIWNDDLIVSLADAYENKRAQQVVEWESVRRQNYQRAA